MSKEKKPADTIISELSQKTLMPVYQVNKANDIVLTKTIMPALIIECGFLTNKEDALRMLDYAFRRKCAEGIYNGILRYFEGSSSKNYTYIKDKNVEIITIDKMSLGTAKVYDSVQNLSEKYKNFINGMFFDYDSNRLHDLCIYNREYLQYKEWYTKSKGTFYIYTDGRIGTATLSKVDKKDMKFLIQGINLSPGADGGSVSLRESMDRQGWNLISDTQSVKRAAIVYDYTQDKVVIIIKTCNLHELRQEVRNRGLVDKNNDTVAIALDAGLSFALTLDGKVIHDTTRFMRNIIFW